MHATQDIRNAQGVFTTSLDDRAPIAFWHVEGHGGKPELKYQKLEENIFHVMCYVFVVIIAGNLLSGDEQAGPQEEW